MERKLSLTGLLQPLYSSASFVWLATFAATSESTPQPPDRRHHDIKIAFSLIIRQFYQMAKSIKKKRTPSAAFMKPVTPDQKLALVIGEKPLPRTELTKKLWAYIRKNGLQDKKVRTQINADENLKAVFNGKKSVSMFEMTKLVSRHVKK
ncbi:MAG: SWIB/MDM2 domain-containing protein [Limisphaerales bacterium]